MPKLARVRVAQIRIGSGMTRPPPHGARSGWQRDLVHLCVTGAVGGEDDMLPVRREGRMRMGVLRGVEHKIALCTANDKHYRKIPGVTISRFRAA
jgi:hypothetical protein